MYFQCIQAYHCKLQKQKNASLGSAFTATSQIQDNSLRPTCRGQLAMRQLTVGLLVVGQFEYLKQLNKYFNFCHSDFILSFLLHLSFFNDSIPSFHLFDISVILVPHQDGSGKLFCSKLAVAGWLQRISRGELAVAIMLNCHRPRQTRSYPYLGILLTPSPLPPIVFPLSTLIFIFHFVPK